MCNRHLLNATRTVLHSMIISPLLSKLNGSSRFLDRILFIIYIILIPFRVWNFCRYLNVSRVQKEETVFSRFNYYIYTKIFKSSWRENCFARENCRCTRCNRNELIILAANSTLQTNKKFIYLICTRQSPYLIVSYVEKIIMGFM